VTSQKAERRWNDWVEDFDKAENEVFSMFYTRSVWRAMTQVFESSPPGRHVTIHNYLVRTYVSTAVSAVRREADRDTRTTSLWRLLERLRSSEVATRSRFAACYIARFEVSEAEALRAFDRFAPNGEEQVVESFIDAAQQRLDRSAKEVRAYANTVVAHRQRPELERPIELSFDQLDRAIDDIGELTKILHELRHPGEMLATASPVLDPGFLAAFRAPLIQPGFVLRQDVSVGD
jgi:hypothetical protein